MSMIGLSPEIRPGPTLENDLVRAVSSSTNSLPQPAVQAGVETSTAVDAGAVPVDQARVALIKQAIQANSYPLNPARIGDAMIAAGMMLRMQK